MSKFRVALSGDFKKPDGSPAFPGLRPVPARAEPGGRVSVHQGERRDPGLGPRRLRCADPADTADRARELSQGRPPRDHRPLRGRLRYGQRAGLHRQRLRARDHARRRAPAGRGVDHHLHAGAHRQAVRQGPDHPAGAERLGPAQRAHGHRPGRPDARLARHRQHRRRGVPPGPAVRHEVHRARPVRRSGGGAATSACAWSGSRSCSPKRTCCR